MNFYATRIEFLVDRFEKVSLLMVITLKNKLFDIVFVVSFSRQLVHGTLVYAVEIFAFGMTFVCFIFTPFFLTFLTVFLSNSLIFSSKSHELRCLVGRRTMYACQIDPTDTAPPCPGWPLRACVGTKGGTLWGRQPFCPHFSSAT